MIECDFVSDDEALCGDRMCDGSVFRREYPGKNETPPDGTGNCRAVHCARIRLGWALCARVSFPRAGDLTEYHRFIFNKLGVQRFEAEIEALLSRRLELRV